MSWKMLRNVKKLVKTFGIEDFELWKCPEKYIHLLDEEKNNKHSLENNILNLFDIFTLL